MYAKKTLNGYFFKLPGFYLFHVPVKVPYKQIYARAEAAGLRPKETHGPILEAGRRFGRGWIAIEVQKPEAARPDVSEIREELEAYEHRGPYRTVGQACQKLSRERPEAEARYHLYLDDPAKTRPEACRTQILFR